MNHHDDEDRNQENRIEQGKRLNDEVLRLLSTDGFPPVELSSDDGTVSVTVNARFQLDSVKIHQLDNDAGAVHRVENALVATVNKAIHEVASRNSARFKEYLGQSTAS